MLLWLIAAVAQAGPALESCCRAAGAPTCPAELEAVGPGATPHGGGLRGLWSIPCDGPARFDGARATTLPGLEQGAVVTPLEASSARCFDASCRLPRGLCIRNQKGRYVLVDCATEQAAPASAWSGPLRAPYGAAVVAGRVLLGSPPPAAAPASPAAPASAPAVAATLDPSVPAPPPDRCIPKPALRQPSIDPVDAGNEAMVAGDWALAADKYRAAITIDPCNPFAWSSLADALLQTGHAEAAMRAAGPATRLPPASAHPFTILGRAAEATGDRQAAIAAFEQALQIQPGHPAAAAALSRLR
jgi:tetratricopeptide (TPR) repeat protein